MNEKVEIADPLMGRAPEEHRNAVRLATPIFWQRHRGTRDRLPDSMARVLSSVCTATSIKPTTEKLFSGFRPET
jgi:hypothetical protein